jgi:hypothetical protein
MTQFLSLQSDQAKAALTALSDAGLVCVPRDPTEEMVKAAWASAEAENAAWVWQDMVEEKRAVPYLRVGNSGCGSGMLPRFLYSKNRSMIIQDRRTISANTVPGT